MNLVFKMILTWSIYSAIHLAIWSPLIYLIYKGLLLCYPIVIWQLQVKNSFQSLLYTHQFDLIFFWLIHILSVKYWSKLSIWRLFFIHIFNGNNTFENLFRPGEDDNEFKGEKEEGSTGDSLEVDFLLKGVMNRRCFLPPIHAKNLSSRSNPPFILFVS